MASVPMKLPSTRLLAVPAKPIRTPSLAGCPRSRCGRRPSSRRRCCSAPPKTMSRPLLALGTAALPRDVGPDEVVRDRVAVRARVADVDAPGLVARDHVVVAGCRVADEVAGGLAGDQHAILAVAQRGAAAASMPDEVVLDEVLSVSKPVRLTPLPALPEMTFGPAAREADEVAGRGGVDGHAVAGVGQGVLAVHVGADVDARDLVGGGPAAGDQDAVAGVVRDDLGGRRGAADDVVGSRRRRWPRRWSRCRRSGRSRRSRAGR